MFENLLHQDRVRSSLLSDIQGGHLAHSMLFSGQTQSGKLSAALELARGLSCRKGTAEWSCRCSSCTQHRLLDSPFLLMMGSRYFLDEIQAAASVLAADPSPPLFYLFYRNVKKLIRRFDPVLWQDEEKKVNKAAALIEKLEDCIEVAHPEKANPGLPDFDKVMELCEAIQKLLPADGLSINMIRKATYWAHTADSSVKKTIIIENAHEMNDAARNAFLKILEEPPASVYFILITTRPGAILPTIRSRLRDYRFSERGIDESRDVISRIYRAPRAETYASIQSFFIDCAPGGLEERRKEIELLFELLRNSSIAARDELVAILNGNRTAMVQLVKLCLEELQQSHLHNEEVYALQKQLEAIHFRSEMYNIPVASALEIGYI